MNKERIKILDNFIDFLDIEDMGYLMRCAIPSRGLHLQHEKEERADNEKLNKAVETLRNPNSNEYHKLCAITDYVTIIKKKESK